MKVLCHFKIAAAEPQTPVARRGKRTRRIPALQLAGLKQGRYQFLSKFWRREIKAATKIATKIICIESEISCGKIRVWSAWPVKSLFLAYKMKVYT